MKIVNSTNELQISANHENVCSGLSACWGINSTQRHDGCCGQLFGKIKWSQLFKIDFESHIECYGYTSNHKAFIALSTSAGINIIETGWSTDDQIMPFPLLTNYQPICNEQIVITKIRLFTLSHTLHFWGIDAKKNTISIEIPYSYEQEKIEDTGRKVVKKDCNNRKITFQSIHPSNAIESKLLNQDISIAELNDRIEQNDTFFYAGSSDITNNKSLFGIAILSNGKLIQIEEHVANEPFCNGQTIVIDDQVICVFNADNENYCNILFSCFIVDISKKSKQIVSQLYTTILEDFSGLGGDCHLKVSSLGFMAPMIVGTGTSWHEDEPVSEHSLFRIVSGISKLKKTLGDNESELTDINSTVTNDRIERICGLPDDLNITNLLILTPTSCRLANDVQTTIVSIEQKSLNLYTFSVSPVTYNNALLIWIGYQKRNLDESVSDFYQLSKDIIKYICSFLLLISEKKMQQIQYVWKPNM